MKRELLQSLLLVSILTGICYSCSKGGSDEDRPANPCAGVTVALTGTVSDAAAGQSNGSISVSATGGSGFTYRLNNGSFQASGVFNNLAAGNYTVTARNSNGCEGSQNFTVGTSNACAGANFSVTAAAEQATPCQTPADGKITITATGAAGFTFSIDGGATFQASNVFANVGAGNHMVIVKDAAGCTKSASVSVGARAAGPLFSAVKQVIQNNCVSCHNAQNAQGGRDWTVDCNIVANKANIKARAVDAAGTPNQMPQPPNPPLSAGDRQKITDWINAGGTYAN